MEYPHQPVLINKTVEYIITIPDGVYVDGTVGTGGHSMAIGKQLSEKGVLICLDRDPDAVRLSKKRLNFLGNSVFVIKANYVDLDIVLNDLGFKEVNGVLLDLGMSSYQLESSGRGFSFSRDEPLDMRMDPELELTARHLVNTLSKRYLAKILKDYGEEKRAKSIAGAIDRARKNRPIETSLQLAVLIKSISRSYHPSIARHPATKTFQALRIAVNRELENLDTFLRKVPALMAKGGRLAFLSYHSLEDRLVKQAMMGWEKECVCPPDFPYCVCGKVSLFRRLFKKGLKPDQMEIDENPRARSALLRVAERT